MVTTLPSDADMLAKIEAFCDRHGMSPTTFGRKAVGDGNFVTGLRGKRSMTLRTGKRIVDFMARYEAPHREAR